MCDRRKDKFFITELLNDLHRNGFAEGSKAYVMLHDWSAELRDDVAATKIPPSKLRQTFNREIGEQNW